MPCQPLALWLLINPEPPGTGRGPVCQTQLGCHPQSFIMMCLFTDDLDVPFERRNKWPGQKCWGHSTAGATGAAAGMLHCLGTQDWIPRATGSVLPLRWGSHCLCFPRSHGLQLGGFSTPCKTGMLKNPNPIRASQCLILPGKSKSCAAMSLSTKHRPILVLFDCELSCSYGKLIRLSSSPKSLASSSPFTWYMELQILSNDQLHFQPHWAPWESLG